MSILNPKTKPVVKALTDDIKATMNTTPGPLPEVVQEGNSSERISNPTNYVYSYGIKNIELSHSLYAPAGIFVTKPIQVEGNIMEVALATVEEHPLFNELGGMATDRVTSIEYYITTKETPSLNDWVSVLPEGTESVKCEKLFFKGSSAVLRFHADISDLKKTRVYKNNMVLKESEWYFTERGAAIQLEGAVDGKALYTIDYVPNTKIVNPWSVKIGSTASEIVKQTDEFPKGTDSNNTVKLSKYPYIDFKAINQGEGKAYNPIEVILKDATIVTANGGTQKTFLPAVADEKEFVTKNRTDYQNSKDVSLRKYSIDPSDTYQSFEYKQEKNKLIFTESFNRSNLYLNQATNHGDATVQVNYKYLVTDFRLKIILRKNVGDDLVVTPTVNSYQLKFKVMK